jgi:hypothetical protein
MPIPVRGLGYFSAGNPQDEFDFARAYANNLSDIKSACKAAGHIPTEREVQHARIQSAVYAVTDLSNTDSMGAFFLDSQDPEDGLFGNLMPEIDWF